MPKITDKEMEQLQKLKKRQKDQNEYLKGKYDRVNITVNKGYKANIEAAASSLNISVNEFCRRAIINAVNNCSLQSAQNTETAKKKQVSKESVPTHGRPESKPANDDRTDEEKRAMLQSIIDAKKAKEAERKRKIEEGKERIGKKRQEEFQNMVNGVINDLRSRKEQRREEDRKKYKDMPDEVMQELLQDKAFCEWLEKIGLGNALEPLAEEIGVNNAERVINAAKERKRKESIENFGCPF